MTQSNRQAAEDLLRFIFASPSPWHVADEVAARLNTAGFKRLDERESWTLAPGNGYYVVRDGSSIIAFRLPAGGYAPALRILGAHTDSPGFRVKPKGQQLRSGLLSLGVEVYGGPIVATFADRDLTLAGRVLVRGQDGLIQSSKLVNFERPILRLPTPAIHLNREVNEQGLKFDPQDELPMLMAVADQQLPPDEVLAGLLATEAGVQPARVASWELAVADTQPGGFFGLNDEFIASARLDNLASCHAGLSALLAAEETRDIPVCAFFDHEEVGSESYKGAQGSFLQDVLARVLEAIDRAGATEERQTFARSLLISVDMAHGFHPNFPRFYDEQHAPRLNAGPVVKINAKQRYATDAVGEAYFASLCEVEGVGCQRYVHRNNLPCGSTIGPIVASRLGIRTIDVGNPMWSMHSARESAGAQDHEAMIRVLTRFFRDVQPLPAA